MSIGKYVKTYVKKFYYRLSKFHDLYVEHKKNYLIIYLKDLDFVNGENIEKLTNKLKILEKKLINNISSYTN